MDAKEIFSKRLKMARQKKGISMEELSEMTNGAVSKQTISKYESGKAMAGTEILSKLALALDVTMDYFLKKFVFSMDEIKISFRKKTSVSVKDENILKSTIQEKVEAYLEIERILSHESNPCPMVSVGTIDTQAQMVRLAREVRNCWGIGNAPIENVKESLIMQGVKVFDVDGPDGFDGVSGAINDSTWIVVLNKSKTHIERRRMTALHEYAHLISNHYFADDLSQKEKEDMCTLFASEMLLPSQVLLDHYKGNRIISLKELESFQCVYGISIDAIMHTLKRTGIISDKRYRGYFIKKNLDPSLKEYVEESRYNEKITIEVDEYGSFETMVYNALAQELITVAKAAELLQCSVVDVQNNAIAF